jgi:hypothetical protein
LRVASGKQRRLENEFSPEFQLAVECCRRSFHGTHRDVAGLPTSGVDWVRFLKLVRFHRVEGPAWNALTAADGGMRGEVGEALSSAATAIAADNLRATVASEALAERFAAASLPLLFLKGLSLGTIAYGKPALKSAIDIDLLIDPADLTKAADLLRQEGYRLAEPADHHLLDHWHRRSKESVWAGHSPLIQIDLHTRTADNPRLIPDINVHSPRQSVEIARGISLFTFATDELIAYLAVHGASSAWFRLKWISDLAALLHGQNASEVERLYRRAQELGAGRAAGQAFLLADKLFSTLVDNSALQIELGSDRATRLLVSAAMRLLIRDPVEPTERFGGTAPIHWTQFLLLSGARYKLTELAGQSGRLVRHLRS